VVKDTKYVTFEELAKEFGEEKARRWGALNVRYVEYRVKIQKQKEWDHATDHDHLRCDLKDYRVPADYAQRLRDEKKLALRLFFREETDHEMMRRMFSDEGLDYDALKKEVENDAAL